MMLTWFATLIFAALMPWGTSVPVRASGRVLAAKAFVGIIVLFHLLLQTFIHAHDPSGTFRSVPADRDFILTLRKLAVWSTMPGLLHPTVWLRMITSSLLFPGWLTLITSGWLAAIIGFPIERKLGQMKMCLLLAALLVAPSIADYSAMHLMHADLVFGGGFSGVMYGLFAAYLALFARSKIYVMGIYDLRFWVVILLFVMPVVSWLHPHAPDLSEIIFVAAAAGLFLLMQPEGEKLAIPILLIAGIKFLQDMTNISTLQMTTSSSVVRIVAGAVTGAGIAFYCNGVEGLRAEYPAAPNDLLRHLRPSNRRPSLATMESAARKSQQAAVVYLGSRVFVGDTDRAAKFYHDVVMPTFPALVLPNGEQLVLARMLDFKGHKAEALHAYRNLLRQENIPKESEIAYLNCARLISTMPKQNPAEGLDLLDQFDAESFTQRDRVESENIRVRLQEQLNEIRPSRAARMKKKGATLPSLPEIPKRRADRADQGILEKSRESEKAMPLLKRMPLLTTEESNEKTFLKKKGEKKDESTKALEDSWRKQALKIENMTSYLETRARRPPYIPETDLDFPRIALRAPGEQSAGTARATGRAAHIETSGLKPLKQDRVAKLTEEKYASTEELKNLLPGADQETLKSLYRIGSSQNPSEAAAPVEPVWMKRMLGTIGPAVKQDEAITADYGEPALDNKDASTMLALATVAVFAADSDLEKIETFAGQYITDSAKTAAPLPDLPGIAGERHSRFLFRKISRDVARAFKDAAEKKGLKVGIASEQNPLFKNPPDEITSVVVENGRIKGIGWTGKVDFKASDISFLSLSRLSTKNLRGESKPKLIIDLILRDSNRRIQIFERTISPLRSSVNGTPLSATDRAIAIIDLYNALQVQATKAVVQPVATIPGPDSEAIGTVHSFPQYDEDVLCAFFSTVNFMVRKPASG